MTPSIHSISPLRQRMLDDMRMRKLEATTQAGYIRAVRRLAAFLKRSPRHRHCRGSAQLPVAPGRSGYLASHTGRNDHRLEVFLRCHVLALRTDGQNEPGACAAQAPTVAQPPGGCALDRSGLQPEVPDGTAHRLRHGPAGSEINALRIGDIDSQRMTLRVEQHTDRYAMLWRALLQRLRVWWRLAHAQGKMLPGGWLFPGMNPLDPLTARQPNRAVHAAAETARID